MSDIKRMPAMGRRNFLKAAGVVALGGLAGLSALEWQQRMASRALGKLAALPTKIKQVGFTDGFVSMPLQAAPVPPFFPDAGAPAPFTSYVFGIRDLTPLASSNDQDPATAAMFAQKGHAQISAPFLVVDQGQDFRVHLHNLGLAERGDLVDSHTLHWHGFPNQIPYFDGVPDNSLSVPIGRQLIYRYEPRDPGTYMYHCHFEDVEHVHMGMTGIVFVRPLLNQNPPSGQPYTKFAFNDVRTGYDREFAVLLSELNNYAHWNDRHLQDTDWTEYKANFRLMNGRAYPDTLVPNVDVLAPAGSLGANERLRFQPNSALIQGNAGERILLRISSLGYEEHSLVLPGIPMWVVGRDAKPLLDGRPDYGVDPLDATTAAAAGARADISWTTDRIDIGPGESRDVILTLPSVPDGTRRVYPLYDRNYGFVRKAAGVSGDGYGGMRTEIHVYGRTTPGLLGGSPSPALPSQDRPNGIYVFNNYPSANTGTWTWASGT